MSRSRTERLCAFAVAALATLALPRLSVADAPEMPLWQEELRPLVGTWKHVHLHKKKEVPLYLVIKEDDGRLRLRYQLPVRDKRYTSDWDGQLKLELQVNMEQKHRTTYSILLEPARIGVLDLRTYSGTWTRPKHRIEGEYVIEEGGGLAFVCRTRYDLEKEKELPCFEPFRYVRVSDATKWPD